MEATWPHLAKHASQPVFWPEGTTRDAKEGLDGALTITATMRGKWRASLRMLIHDAASYLQWQAFLMQMEGQFGTTLVPSIGGYRPRDDQGRSVPGCNLANLDNAQTFEHFGFSADPVTRVKMKAAAALRATQIDLTYLDTTGLQPGHDFSIGDEMHRVQHHWEPDGATHRITFWPPLRKAWGNTSPVEVVRPVCRMRFASADEGRFDGSLGTFQTVTCNFIEAV